MVLLFVAAFTHPLKHLLQCNKDKEDRPCVVNELLSDHIEGLKQKRQTNKEKKERYHLVMRAFASTAFAHTACFSLFHKIIYYDLYTDSIAKMRIVYNAVFIFLSAW